MLYVAYFLAGCAMRFLVPYLLSALGAVSDAGKWSAWPRFEPRYLTSFIGTAIAFGVAMVTVPPAWPALVAMQPIAIVGMAYVGQDIVGKVAKAARRH